MGIEKAIEITREYPLFVRGTCVEEAVWLLGANRDKYKSRPDTVYAFPIREGFDKVGIVPVKPIPKNYNLKKMRDEILLASDVGVGPSGPSRYIFGDSEHDELFAKDEERLGVAIYFSPRIVTSSGYRQDPHPDREDEMCAVEIPIPKDFDPQNICIVEALGPTDYSVLRRNFKSHSNIFGPRFTNREDWIRYTADNLDDITFGKNGFTFPE